jgi:hypothetical protein
LTVSVPDEDYSRNASRLLNDINVFIKQWWPTIQPISTKRNTTSHLKSLNTKEGGTTTLDIQILTWDRYRYVAGINRLIGYQHPYPDNRMYSGNTEINKQYIIHTDSLPLNRSLMMKVTVLKSVLFSPITLQHTTYSQINHICQI